VALPRKENIANGADGLLEHGYSNLVALRKDDMELDTSRQHTCRGRGPSRHVS
jgi:hypothetical protein